MVSPSGTFKFKILKFKRNQWGKFFQGKMGRYLDDLVMEDEVFLEQDQLMRPGSLKGRLTANQL